MPLLQIESTHQSFDAGPSFVHIHVRKPDETPASDRILFCSGARGRAQTLSLDDHSIFDWRSPTGAAARGSALYLKPDMASLSTGSVNFPTNVHENCAAGRRLGDTNAETQRASRDRNLRSDIHGARRLVDS